MQSSDRHGTTSQPGQTIRSATSTDNIFAEFFGSSDRHGTTSQPDRTIRSATSTDNIFAEFFGSSDRHGTTSQPGDGSASVRFNPRSADDIFAEFFGSSSSIGQPSYTGGEGSANPPRPHKAAPIENRLLCNLEDLYKGATKKIKISREILDSNGRTMSVEEIITINIKPGWKKGTKITFPEKGNEAPGIIAADIVFIVDEKPHEVFTREGNDLIMTQKISLAEALTGYNAQVTTLDGRHLSISINSDEVVVPKEGMPIPKEPSKKR